MSFSWIATLAVGAIIICAVGSAAVAAIPVAPAEVVDVVTVSVANETDDFTIFGTVFLALRFWVQAFALGTAILQAVQKAGASITTVTVVPVAPAVIVLRIAKLVADPGTLATLAIALPGIFAVGVQTSAISTILVIFVTAAVATIPVANLVVV